MLAGAANCCASKSCRRRMQLSENSTGPCSGLLPKPGSMQTPEGSVLTLEHAVTLGATQKQPGAAPTLGATLKPEVITTLGAMLTCMVLQTSRAHLRQGLTLSLGDKAMLGVRGQTTGHAQMLGRVQSHHSSVSYHSSRRPSNHDANLQWQTPTMVVT